MISPTVLNTPHGTQDNPHGTHDIPLQYCTHIIQGGYDDICKTGIYNHYIPIKAERKIPLPLKGIEETDILSLLLKDGEYKRAFRYMFETGNPIPLKIVPKLLNALRGHRLSFYSLIDLKLNIFAVSNRTRNQITRLLIGPQGSHRIFLGAFKIYQLKFAERNAINPQFKTNR